VLLVRVVVVVVVVLLLNVLLLGGRDGSSRRRQRRRVGGVVSGGRVLVRGCHAVGMPRVLAWVPVPVAVPVVWRGAPVLVVRVVRVVARVRVMTRMVPRVVPHTPRVVRVVLWGIRARVVARVVPVRRRRGVGPRLQNGLRMNTAGTTRVGLRCVGRCVCMSTAAKVAGALWVERVVVPMVCLRLWRPTPLPTGIFKPASSVLLEGLLLLLLLLRHPRRCLQVSACVLVWVIQRRRRRCRGR